MQYPFYLHLAQIPLPVAVSEDKYARRRLRSSYFSTVVSITLVLFMLGLVGLIVLHANQLSQYVKENLGFTIYLKNEVKEVDRARLQKTLDAAEYVRLTKYISKEEAAEELKADLGEDFISFIGHNPLLANIEVKLNAEFANSEKMDEVEQELLSMPEVKEVTYQRNLVQIVNKRIRLISLVLLGFSGLLLVIAIALINNSIRLAIYSRRFLIRTMQLVGATHGFIRRPFLWSGIRQGIFGAMLAIAMILGLLYYISNALPELTDLGNTDLIAALFILITTIGVFISWISTFFAVRKYLRIKTDRLF